MDGDGNCLFRSISHQVYGTDEHHYLLRQRCVEYIIKTFIKDIIDDKLLGVMLSCVSPENYEKNLEELKNLDVPFGFKINGFITTKPKNGYTSTFKKSNGNPNEFLGQREDLTPQKINEIAKKFKDSGATILGGCCETRPLHIEAIAKLK